MPLQLDGRFGADGRMINVLLRGLVGVTTSHSMADAEGAALYMLPAALTYASATPDNLAMAQQVAFDWCRHGRRVVLAPRLRHHELTIARVVELRARGRRLSEETRARVGAAAAVIGAMSSPRLPPSTCHEWEAHAPRWPCLLLRAVEELAVDAAPPAGVLASLQRACGGALPSQVELGWWHDDFFAHFELLWRDASGHASPLADAAHDLPHHQRDRSLPGVTCRELWSAQHYAYLLLASLGCSVPRRPRSSRRPRQSSKTGARRS